MLEEHGIDYTYRDYREERLDTDELRRVLDRLGLGPKQVLRRRDRAFRDLGLSGQEDDDVLIAHMSIHPTLLERPIGLTADGAVVGRPPERLLELATKH